MKNPEQMTDDEIMKELADSEKDPSTMTDDELESELKSLEASEVPPGPVETFFRSAGSAATLNYLPEILAATDITPGKAYGTKLKEQVERTELGEIENPTASTIGTVAGIGTGIATGAPLAAGAKKLAQYAPRAAKSIAPFMSEVLMNMGLNLAQNPSHDVTGDADKTEQRIDQVTNPLALATAVGGPVVGKIAEKAIDPISQAISALGFKKSDIKNMMERGSSATLSEKNMVKEAKRMKILRPITTLDGIHERASLKAEQAGKKIGKLMAENTELMNEWYSSLDSNTRGIFEQYMRGNSIANMEGLAVIRNTIMDEMSSYGQRGEKAAKEAMSVVEAAMSRGGGDLEDMWALKGRLSKLVYGESQAVAKSGASTLQKEAYQAALGKVNDMIDKNIQLLEHGLLSAVHSKNVPVVSKYRFKGISKKYEELKRQYSVARAIENSTLDKIASERARSFSIKDVLPSTSVPAALSYAGDVAQQVNKVPFIQQSIIGVTRPEMTYGGFPESQTMPVDLTEMPLREMEILQEEIEPSKKAKRLNLLRKYQRIYVGQ